MVLLMFLVRTVGLIVSITSTSKVHFSILHFSPVFAEIVTIDFPGLKVNPLPLPSPLPSLSPVISYVIIGDGPPEAEKLYLSVESQLYSVLYKL